MYFETAVQVPDLKKLSSFNPIKSDVSQAYYTVASSYDSSKKYSCPKKNCIGKILDKQNGLVQPKSTTLFPELLPCPKRGDTLSFLPYIVMIEEAKLIGLYDPLKKHFPDQFLDILALVLFNLWEGDLIADRFLDFHFHRFDGLNKAILSSSISKLYTKLGNQEDKIQAFFLSYFIQRKDEPNL